MMVACALALLAGAEPVESKDFSNDLQKKALRATVRFDIDGSGVIIKRGPIAFVLTADHVLAGLKKVNVVTYLPGALAVRGKVYRECAIVARDKEKDLALIQILTDDPLPFIPICPPQKVPENTIAVMALGCQSGESPVCHVDLRAEKRHYRRPKDKNATWFWEVNKDQEEGWSGGPLVDKRGYLLGICSGRSDGKGYYCHSDEIYEFLRANGMRWLAKESTP
jgi:S1-C subfamily serine protease